MKKLIVIVVLIVAGFFTFRYFNMRSDRTSQLQQYKKDIELSMGRLDEFFLSVDRVLDEKDVSKIKNEVKTQLIPDLKTIEGTMVMIASKDPDTQKLHMSMYKCVGETKKSLKAVAKSKKPKKVLSKEVKAMAEEYEEFTATLEKWYSKYKVNSGDKPDATKAPTKYDKYNSYLDSVQ